MKKRTLTFRMIALFLCFSLVFSGINPITIYAEDDPSDLGEYTTAAQNGRSVIFNLVDVDNQIAESYNINAVAAESGVPGTDPHIPVSFTVTSSARTSSTSHFNFSVTPGTYRTKLDKNGLYTILDLTCTMRVPHHLRQLGVGDDNLPNWVKADSSYLDNYPGGRFGAYNYNSQGCVGYAVFQLPRNPDGADRANYTFQLQINIGNFRMNTKTSSNTVAKKTYQFRYNKCAFLLNMSNCLVNEDSGYSRGNGYLTHIATGTQVFQKNFDGVAQVFSPPDSFGIYKPGYAFSCWQSTTNSSKTYKADGVTSYALEDFSDHANSTINVVNVNDDNPGQGWAGTNPKYTILQELQPVWNLLNYSISYNLQGGSVSGNPSTYTIETNTFTLKNPTRTGYTFTGWTGSSSGKTISVPKGSTGNLSFTANWTPINYNITYDLDGGSVSGNPSTYTIETKTFTLKNPTRTGYTFLGWTGSNGTAPSKSVTIEKGSTGNLSFTANWAPTIYNITYDLDGGSVSGNPSTYTIETDTFTLKNPTRTGYTFLGWTGSNGTTPNKSVTIEKGSTGNKTYKAVWTATHYTITYDLKGGTVNGSNPTGYDITTPTFTLINPTRAGYTFTGWTGSFSGEEVSVPKGTTGNLSFTANWQENRKSYTITFELNGGGFSGNNAEEENELFNNSNQNNYVEGAELDTLTWDMSGKVNTILSLSPSKRGYSFKGWYYQNGAKAGEKFFATDEATENVTVEAVWELIEYDIEYDYAGGTDANNPSTYTVETETFTLKNPTRTGYTFDGWTGSNGTTPDKTVSIQEGSIDNLSFTANWTPIEYHIQYDYAGGTDVNNPGTYTIETDTFTLKNPTRTGYTFLGWTGSNGTAPSKSVTIEKGSTGDLSFTANWKLNQYDIQYDYAGGTDVNNPSTYTIETDTFTLKNPTRTGYTFDGWTGSNGSTPNKSVTVEKGSTGDLSFTANWTPIEYHIQYDYAGGTDVNNPDTYTIETDTFTLKNPTRTGYTFDGWTGSNGTAPSKSVTIEKGSTGDLSFTANWTPDLYHILYHYNGGTDTNNPGTYTIETETFTLMNPFRTGYTFEGWTGSNGFVASIMVQVLKGTIGDLVFHANWLLDTFPIEYDYAGGTDANNPGTYTVETETFTLVNPTRDGYIFDGWTGSNGSTPEPTVSIPKGTTGQQNYKANWTPVIYNIKYDYNGGKSVFNPTVYTVESPTFTLNNPTRKGYTFLGWTGSNGKKPMKNVSIPTGSKGERSYKANWKKVAKKVSIKKMPYLNVVKKINKGSKFKFHVYGVSKKKYNIYWHNTNSKVLSLSKKGIGTAKKNGKTIVSYQLYNKKTGKLAYGFRINVKVITTEFETLNTSKKLKVSAPTFMFDKTIKVNGTFKLGFKKLEKGAKISYTSSDKKTLTVSQKGLAKAKKEGFCYVTIKLKQNGITYHYRVHFKCEK